MWRRKIFIKGGHLIQAVEMGKSHGVRRISDQMRSMRDIRVYMT